MSQGYDTMYVQSDLKRIKHSLDWCGYEPLSSSLERDVTSILNDDNGDMFWLPGTPGEDLSYYA